mmetsp:Transcript_15406/g.42628  ORF Transcript_15406/g.42628 Transcript_15406/m.42628 type:complete len:237 (-) Transcript_15406:1081-1791(-)
MIRRQVDLHIHGLLAIVGNLLDHARECLHVHGRPIAQSFSRDLRVRIQRGRSRRILSRIHLVIARVTPSQVQGNAKGWNRSWLFCCCCCCCRRRCHGSVGRNRPYLFVIFFHQVGSNVKGHFGHLGKHHEVIKGGGVPRLSPKLLQLLLHGGILIVPVLLLLTSLATCRCQRCLFQISQRFRGIVEVSQEAVLAPQLVFHTKWIERGIDKDGQDKSFVNVCLVFAFGAFVHDNLLR